MSGGGPHSRSTAACSSRKASRRARRSWTIATCGGGSSSFEPWVWVPWGEGKGKGEGPPVVGNQVRAAAAHDRQRIFHATRSKSIEVNHDDDDKVENEDEDEEKVSG